MGTHCIEGRVGDSAGLEGCGKSRPQPGFDPRTIKPVASHYNCIKYYDCLRWYERLAEFCVETTLNEIVVVYLKAIF